MGAFGGFAIRAFKSASFWTLYLPGFLWGLLPCGLVLTALLMAASTTDALLGALTMLLFGLATLPSLFAVKWLAARAVMRVWGRALASLVMMLFGFQFAMRGFASLGMVGHFMICDVLENSYLTFTCRGFVNRRDEMNLSKSYDSQDTQPKRIRDLFSQRNFGSAYLATTLEFLHFLARLGFKPKEDGWRKFATAFLRSEDSRFALAVFRLDVARAEDENDLEQKPLIVTRLRRFFREHSQLWETRLVWTRQSARVIPNPQCDLIWAEFDAQGNLARIQPFFNGEESARDPNHPHTRIFIEAYNRTRQAGRQRPYHRMAAVRGC